MLIRTIYIAGKVTGLPPEETAAKFAAAADYWAENGCHPINPVVLVNNIHADWEMAMRKCIGALLDCQAIYLLPDWQTSRGTRLEILIANAIGIDIILQDLKQMSALTEYLNTYSWKGDAFNQYVQNHCQCITAAAKYRCRHANGYDKCDLNDEKENGTITHQATAQGAGIQRAVGSIYISDAQKAFEAFTKSFGSMQTSKPLFAEEERQQMVLKTVARAMAASVEHQPWYTRAWEKLCVAGAVLACMPWVAWQFIKNPYDFVRLPIAEENDLKI
jgi:hypothetical protein